MNNFKKGLKELIKETVEQNQPDFNDNILTKKDAKKLIKQYALKEYLNATEAAEYLSVSQSKFWRMRKSGHIKSVVIDNMTRWRKSDLDEYVDMYGIEGYC